MNTLYPKNLILENDFIRLKECRHGLMVYNKNDTSVGKSLDHYGEWSEKELELLAPLIKMGDVILDIGANIGTHTLFFAEHVKPSGKVIAFEPQRFSFQMLNANVALNALLVVECYQKAVTNENGFAEIPLISPKIEMNFGGIALNKYGESVPTIKIDDLQLTRCDLIKIDIEGFEILALQGAEQTIKKCRPIIFLENNRDVLSQHLLEFFQKHQYRCWWFFSYYFNENNFFHNSTNLFDDGNDPYMICFPNEYNIDSDFSFEGLIPTEGVNDTDKKAFKRKQTV